MFIHDDEFCAFYPAAAMHTEEEEYGPTEDYEAIATDIPF